MEQEIMSLIQKKSSVNTDYYFWRSQGGMKLLSSQEGWFFWLITSLNAPHVFQVQMKTFDPLYFSTREQYQIIVLRNRIQKKSYSFSVYFFCFFLADLVPEILVQSKSRHTIPIYRLIYKIMYFEEGMYIKSTNK